MAKVPTRSPTHLDVELRKLAALGLEVEELASDGWVSMTQLIELAEDRGKPVSHYLAALALCDDVAVTPSSGPVVKVCAGSCQQWGALDVLDHLATRWERAATFSIVAVSCLDRCDRASVCQVDSANGTVIVEEANPARLDETLDALLA
jgi:NADH:ubiquinone oxidoreductase subunit E